MFGWSIRASACRSASNRASTCLDIHARLDHLQGDHPLDRAGLLGHVDGAHAALADRLQQLVGADDGAGTFSDRHIDGRRGIAGVCLMLEESARLIVCVQQGVDSLLQFVVVAAGRVEKCRRASQVRTARGQRRKGTAFPDSASSMGPLRDGWNTLHRQCPVPREKVPDGDMFFLI